jgi:hypothetical protein
MLRVFRAKMANVASHRALAAECGQMNDSSLRIEAVIVGDFAIMLTHAVDTPVPPVKV